MTILTRLSKSGSSLKKALPSFSWFRTKFSMSTSKLAEVTQSELWVDCSHFSNSSANRGNNGCLQSTNTRHVHTSAILNTEAFRNTHRRAVKENVSKRQRQKREDRVLPVNGCLVDFHRSLWLAQSRAALLLSVLVLLFLQLLFCLFSSLHLHQRRVGGEDVGVSLSEPGEVCESCLGAVTPACGPHGDTALFSQRRPQGEGDPDMRFQTLTFTKLLFQTSDDSVIFRKI